MGLLETIVGGGVGQLVKTVVGTFKLSPEAKAEIDKQIEDHRFELEKLDREYETKLLDAQTKEIEAASASIRAEASSGDPYTSRARPTFLYLMYCVLGWNYILIPLLQFTTGKPPMPVDLPADLLTLFGAGYLGYVHYRSNDKKLGR